MKFLIWFFALGIPGFIPILLDKIGIHIGGFLPTLILYSIAFFVAKFLCAKWDVKVFEKEASRRGMKPGEYASNIFPPSLLDLCDARKNDPAAFRSMLKQNIDAEVITKANANVLLYMYGIGLWV